MACDVTTKLSVTNKETLEIKSKMRKIMLDSRMKKLLPEAQQKLFKDLIESYKDYVTDDIKATFSEVAKSLGIDTNYNIFFSEQGIRKILTSDEPVQVENPPVIQDVEQIKQRRMVRTGMFMLEAYKDASEVRQKVEKEISVALCNALLLNREKGRAVNSTNAMNENIREYQQELLNKIANVIKKYLINSGTYKILPKFFNNPVMYENGVYTGAVESILKYDTKILNFTPDQLIKFSNDPSKKELLDAYNAKVILTHFDSLMVSKYGRNIVIKNFGDGIFSGENKYSWATKGASMTDGFANPEEMVIESLIDRKMQELIISTPLFQYNSNKQIGYLQVSDFSNVLGRLKEFAWNGSDYNVPERLIDGLQHDSTKQLAKQYSLVQMINLIKEDGGKYLPAIFEILSNENIFNNIKSTHPELLKNFPPQYKQIVYSIYKGIFSDSGNSVNSITKGKLSRTLFDEMVQLADSIYQKKFMQYREYDNVITSRDMSESNYDQNERLIRTKINTINSKLINRFQNLISKDFDLEFKNEALYVSYKGKLLGEISRNGSISNMTDFDSMENLIAEVLGLPNISQLVEMMPNDNVDISRKNIQRMALHSLYLAWVNNNHSDSPEQYITTENGKSIRKNNLGEVDLIHQNDSNTIKDLANAISIQQGILSSSQVRDGSGNARSISGLSYLIGSINSQLELQNKREGSATINSLYVRNPGIFKGIYDSKEVITNSYGAKVSTEWNVGEFITSGFIYDFIGGLVGKDRELLKGGTIAVLASVNSDKNTISKLLIDLNAKVKVPNTNVEKQLGRFTNHELLLLINEEFGNIYQNIYNNIESDLNKLFEYSGYNFRDQYIRNFSDFNDWCYKNNINATEHLRQLVREYNLDNREEPLHLIDQVHYLNQKGIPQSNQTLFSLLSRFSPKFLTDRGVDISKYPTSVQFWNYKAAEIIQSLFAGKFSINFDNPTIHTEKLKELLSAEWIDSYSNQMIFAKVKYNGKTLNLIDSESEFELRQLLGIPVNADLGEALRSFYNNKTIEIQLNPQIARYNLLDYFGSQEHMISTVGSHIAHPAKGETARFDSTGLDFIYEEAARFNAQHKRNVSFTATMSEFSLGFRNGIPRQYNVAVIDDINDVVHTISGQEEETKPFDGATFVNPFVVYLENNSLGASKVGLTKKQFVHAYNERTGTGIIIKTAGFAMTNNVIRNSKLLQTLVEKMTNRAWDQYYDITRDENGNRIVYGDIGQGGERYLYYKNGDKYYAIRTTGITKVQDGRYIFPTVEVTKKGEIISKENPIEHNIFSNYDLWNAFGGFNSLKMSKNGLIYGEESIKAVVEAINNVNYIDSNGKLIQPLKKFDIHYVCDSGSIKQGAANINSKSTYYDDNPLDFMKVNMYQAGVQLDKEHSAENSELALMTQVISACAHLGFTASDAGEIYNALYTLTEHGTRDLLKSFEKFVGNEIKPEDFSAAIINSIFKQIATQNVSENNLITTIAQDLVEKIRDGKQLDNDEALSLPIDDNAIYSQFLSKLSVFLTDSGIKMKIPGILAVLNPSYENIKLYGDRKLEEINDFEELQKNASVVVSPEVVTTDGIVPSTTDYSKVKFGRTYRVKFKVPEFIPIQFKDGRFASSSKDGTIYYRNTPVSVEEFFEYITGRNESPTSKQKQEVFRLLAKEGFSEQLLRDLIQTPEDVQKFILWHEMSHLSRPKALENYYYKEQSQYGTNYTPDQIDWLSPDKIKEEFTATIDAVTKLLTEKEGFKVFKVKDRKNFIRLIPEMSEAVEDCTVGRNLGSYDATFIYNNRTYSIWDLDSVDALYSIRDAKTIQDLKAIVEKYKDINPELNEGTFNLLNTFESYYNYLETVLRRWTRHDNAMFSKKRNDFFDDNSVYINHNLFEIDLDTVKIDSYELGLPKVYATEFGLDEDASVYEISHNKNYFTTRILQNIKAQGQLNNNWDFCLKRANGNHLYILDEANLVNTEGLYEVEINKINQNNKIFRTDEMDRNMYQMRHEEDRVFSDGAIEIIVTKKPQWYLNKMSYNILSINPTKDASSFSKSLSIINGMIGKTNHHGIFRYLNYIGRGTDVQSRNNAIESPSDNNSDLMDLYNKLGTELWTSFMLTLKAVASRTPSQSMQSVMAMKIAFFDNENLNNAYVCSDQFFLQGSDLDIDAASIALFGVAKNGKVPLWTPYSNYKIAEGDNQLANIEKSMELPFPTGKEVNFVQLKDNTDTINKIIELYNKYSFLVKQIGDSENFIEVFDGYYDNLIALIKDVNQNGLPISYDYINMVAGNKIIDELGPVGEKYIRGFIHALEKIVNRHNLYLDSLSEETIELIAKNYNMYKMYSITNDPINLIQSQSSVDSMTSTAKRIANQSESAELARTRTPGNFANKYESIHDNQVGAKGIGICAVGLKGFFGATQYNNIVLNSDRNALTRLKLGPNGKTFITPDGKELHFDYLANINPSKNAPWVDAETYKLYQQFRKKGFDNDAALQLSVLLSLATDNAKELALAKLNASDKTLGMYIYGLSIGMKFEDVSSILMSPVGRTLTSVMEGNVFNNDNGLFSIDKVFDYFELGPRNLVQRNKIGFNTLANNLLSERGYVDTWTKLAKYAWNYDTIVFNPTGTSAEYVRALRQYRTYFRQVQLIKQNINVYNSLKELYFGAEEMRHLGAILGLNQGIATRMTDIVGKLTDVERIYQQRVEIINNETRRKTTLNWYKNPNVNRFKYEKETANKFKLNDFFNNPQSAISSYERIKHSINILDVVNTIPHFKGYFKMLNLLDQCAKNAGHRYLTTRDLLNIVSDEHTPKSELERLTKKIEWFYGDYLRNEWLISKQVTFSLPDGNRVYNDNIVNERYSDKGGIIRLGTRWGNASYKYYIENILIPQLQKDPTFKDNVFIKNLQPDITTLTVDNIPRVYMVTGINMLPSSEAERAVFNEYKAAFNSIADEKVIIGNKSMNLRDAFYLYGLIAHYGKQGRASLMPIFENQHNKGYLAEFHKYQSQFKGIQINSEIVNQLDEYIIPYKSPWQAIGEPAIYWKNDKGEVVKWNPVQYEENDQEFMRSDVINGYKPQSIKYSDNQIRNYDMASVSMSPIRINNEELFIVNGKFKGGKLDGIDVPYQVDPVTKRKFVDETEVKVLLNKMNC